jgi:hypothetical protein
MLHHTSRWGTNCQTSSCHGPAGGAPAAGVGGGVSTGRIPRGAPPGPQLGAAGRDSHQGTGTQTSTFCEYPAEPRAPAGPLPSELPPTCVTAAWCGPITMVLAREASRSTQKYDLKAHHPPCICWWLAKPDHRSGTFHSRRIGVSKGKLHI